MAKENEIPAENSAVGKPLFYAAWRQQVQQQQVQQQVGVAFGIAAFVKSGQAGPPIFQHTFLFYNFFRSLLNQIFDNITPKML